MHGQQHGEAIGVPADHRASRRAEPRGNHQRLDLDQNRPRPLHAGEYRRSGAEASRSPRNSSDGLATSRRPSDGHLEHADLVGGAEAVLGGAQDAEGVAAVALEIEHGIDHVLDHLGAGDLPSLVTWPTSTRAAPCALAKRMSDCVAARTWLTVPGAASSPSAHSVWIEFDHDEIGALALGERRQDVGEVGLAGQRQRRLGQAQALGPQAHLRAASSPEK